jgi:hypothetical protein
MKKIAYILILLSGFLYLSCFDGTQEIPQDNKYPEIVLRQGSVQLFSGDTSTIDNTLVGNSTSVTYVIENVGKEYLYLEGSPIVDISGANASEFVVTMQPSDTLSPFSYRTFEVVFTPAAAGARTATLTINSNDPEVSSFAVDLSSSGTTVIAPEINIQLTGIDIANGGSRSLGTTNVGFSGTYTFTIQNTSTTGALTVSSPSIDGADSGYFQILPAYPGGVIPAPGSDTFDLVFTPTDAVTRSVDISIPNDDTNENPYTFTVTATGVVLPAPEIDVRQGSTPLTSGISDHPFSDTNIGSSSAVVTFIINNLGNADLTPLTVTMAPSVHFTLNAGSVTDPLAGSDSTTFTVRFNPTATGPLSTTVTITHNDSTGGENPFTFTVSGTGVAIPDINVLNPASATITSGSTYNLFAALTLGVDSRIFNVQNLNNGSILSLPATPVVDITGDSAFSITGFPAASIGFGILSPLTIEYNPTEAGTHSAIVTIVHNDFTGGENPYTFTVQGTATDTPAPNIELRQGANIFMAGDTYDLGGMVVGGTVVPVTFSINNTGTSLLTLSGVFVEISNTTDFVLDKALTGATVAAGLSTTFTIGLNPGTSGFKTSTVTVHSDDSDEPTYVFNVSGTGMNPEINLMQDVTSIADGGNFLYGDVNVGSSKDYTFTIQNTGADTLYLTGSPRVAGGGSGFSVLSQPTKTNIVSGGTATFVVRFTPAGVVAGANTTFTIANSDADEGSYDFTVTANGVTPEIQISQGVTPYNVGSTFSFPNVNYIFPTPFTGVSRTFDITNSGTANLLLIGSPLVQVTGTDFTVTQMPTLGNLPALTGSDTFIIKFNPSLPLGLKTATVTVLNNDTTGGESSYSFTVQGVLEDTENPVVNISSPVNGTYIRGTVNVDANATDNVSVSNVEFFRGVTSLGVDSGAPYSVSWDTTLVADGVYALSATATDPSFNSSTDNDTSVTVDNTAPGLVISAPSVSYAKNGATVTYTVTYTETNLNSITLGIGDIVLNAAGATATVDSVTVTGALTRLVTLTTGAGNGTVGISINAGTASDLAGNTAPAAGPSTTFTVDNTPPTLIISTLAAEPTNLSPFMITFTSSETVTGFDVSDITVGNGSAGLFTTISGTTYTAWITPSAQGAVTVDVAGSVAQDLALNDNTAAVQLSRTYDSILPTVVLTTGAPDPFNSATFTVTATFSETVTGVAIGDFTVVNGTTSNFIPVSGTVYTVDITPSGQGAVTVDMGAGVAQDAATNGNTAAAQLSRVYDSIQPTVVISSTAPADTNVSPIPVTITFSESVTGFAVGDIVVGNGTAGNFAGSGTTYTADITPSGQGAVTVDVAGGVAQDAAANVNTAAVQLSRNYDTAAPTVVISSTAPADTNVSPIPVTITFSENVTGFVVGDITVVNGTAGNFAGSGTTYTADITPLGQGAVTVDVNAGVAADAATNVNTAAVQLSRVYDSIQPTVVISSTAPADTNVSPIPVTITFSENVTGFVVGDITVVNGTAGNFAGSGTTYTADITPLGQGAVTVDVNAGVGADAAANGNTAAVQLNRTYDSVQPTVLITSGGLTSTNAAFTATFTFSENVTGFVSGSIAVTNATVSGFAGSGSVYTALITPIAEGSVTVDVAGSEAQDAALNWNTAAIQLNVIYDITAPIVAITSPAAGDVIGTDTLNFSVTEINGFTTYAQITGYTSGAFSNGSTFTALPDWVSIGEDVGFTVSVTATDDAGNSGSDSRSFTRNETP